MPSERENNLPILTPRDYEIAGNAFRAYYDARHKLAFVIDSTTSADKPNVLLVLNPVGDRKWDDVLANDFGVDLETVRPKKDNKYQKLDIEYSGLAIYDDLIARFESGNEIDDALLALAEFRNASVRRAASERLESAEFIAANTRETIVKANEAIGDLETKTRELKTKLSRQRKDVGREPTKQSASKILRTEAQIDATNEKIKRTKKRLANAQKRLVAAEDDAQRAREILERIPVAGGAASHDIMIAPANEVVVTRDNLPAEIAPKFTEIISFDAPVVPDEPIITSEQKAENMADEEVKPLFDKDPEILNEEIAFKPIDFDVSSVEPVPQARAVSEPAPVAVQNSYDDTPAPVQPLSFTPPTENNNVVNNVQPAPISVAPVLDSITAVDAGPESETVVTEFMPRPVVTPEPAPAPMPEISPAPATSALRPVSPITGTAPATGTAGARTKPTLLYYIMLIMLIIMSIFTLWLYQKSTGDSAPDLAASMASMAPKEPAVAPTPDIAVPDTVVENVAPDPFIVSVAVTEPQADEIMPEPTPSVMVEPVVNDFVPDVPAEPVESVEIESTVSVPNEIPEPVVTTIEPVPVAVPIAPVVSEPVVNKPAYGVSSPEKMFVSASEYNAANKPASDEASACANGGMPDMYGCCPGETFTDMGGGAVACCVDGECFDPMI